jgi:hypothetical protein
VQHRSGRRAEPRNIAGVGRYFWFVECDMKHCDYGSGRSLT